MNNGAQVLAWIRENGRTVTEVAATVGYSRHSLSRALNHDNISAQLAAALNQHFGLEVKPKPKKWTATSSKRPPGRAPGPLPRHFDSMLDPHRDEIEALLANGSTQKFIASRFKTSEANLHVWMKKHLLKRRSTDNN